MTVSLHHHADVTVNRRRVVRRRDFLRSVSLGAAAVGLCSWSEWMSLQAAELRRQGMSCILLWMAGGPSQFETWDPKPGHDNGGETKDIATSVPGIRIAENLPETARVMDEICLIRSLTGREGAHARASYLMHTGYLPMASVQYPTLGSIAAQQLADPSFDLPSFVRVGGTRGGADGGFLGVQFDPFEMSSAERPPENTSLPTNQPRFRRRMSLLGKLEAEFGEQGAKQEVANQSQVYDKAADMVLSPKMDVFDIEREPRSVREAYGESPVGAGCLLARRLVESGVTFVEVTSNGWDTHLDNFDRSRDLCQQVDQPYAQLLRDLRHRGMLDKTLVLWMGEFGRTPRINPRGGRDHYPQAFSVAMAGGGVRGGQVVGATDAGGVKVTDRPVGVADLLRTVCQSLQIDADHENMSSIGRPIPIVDGGAVVTEVFG